jgi:hypothetical protein
MHAQQNNAQQNWSQPTVRIAAPVNPQTTIQTTPTGQLPGGASTISKYDYLGKIGEGTYGVVYLAVSKDNARQLLAIKTFKTARVRSIGDVLRFMSGIATQMSGSPTCRSLLHCLLHCQHQQYCHRPTTYAVPFRPTQGPWTPPPHRRSSLRPTTSSPTRGPTLYTRHQHHIDLPRRTSIDRISCFGNTTPMKPLVWVTYHYPRRTRGTWPRSPQALTAALTAVR